jgi:hypothetical protein
MIKLTGFKATYLEETKTVAIEDTWDNRVISPYLNDLLNFLCEPNGSIAEAKKTYELKFAWDLDELFAVIARQINTPDLKTIQKGEPMQMIERYIPGKMLLIKNEWGKTFVFHLSQFFPEGTPEPKDLNELHGMARLIVDMYHNQFLIDINTLMSPVRAFRNAVYKYLNLCNVSNIPDDSLEVIKYAENCLDAHGEWVESYKMGSWKAGDTQTYDQVSAYPYQASLLYDLTRATYTKSTAFVEGSQAGFCHVVIDIDKSVKVHPISYLLNDYYIYPVGKFETWLTLDECIWMQKRNLAAIRLIDGWFVKYHTIQQPLNKILNRLYVWRQGGTIANYNAKRIAAGIWGMMIAGRLTDQVNEWYNPLWAVILLSRVRLKIADFIYDNSLQDALICVQTDSITSSKPTIKPMPTDSSKSLKMGDWRLVNACEPLIVLSRGLVYRPDKKPKSLYYDDVVKLIEAKPKASYYSKDIERIITLQDVAEGTYPINMIGKEKIFKTSFDLNLIGSESDRIYPKLPKNGSDLLNNIYDSLPIEINE